MSEQQQNVIQLNGVRLAFPALWEKKQVMDSWKFSACLLLPVGSEVHAKAMAAVEAVGSAKWGAKWPQVRELLQKQDRLGVRDGSIKSYDGFGEGMDYINASSDTRPTVVDRDRSPLTKDDGRPYAGCYCNFRLNPWAQDNQYGKRINFSLLGLQFARDGDRFSGAPPAKAEDFDELADEDDDGGDMFA